MRGRTLLGRVLQASEIETLFLEQQISAPGGMFGRTSGKTHGGPPGG